MKTVAMIPARYAATRFPAKLMQVLGKKTVIRHTYDNTVATGLFDQVVVVTDSELIYREIVDNGGAAVMSKRPHESGRTGSPKRLRRWKWTSWSMYRATSRLSGGSRWKCCWRCSGVRMAGRSSVGSLVQVLKEQRFIDNPNYVKVALDKNNNALFFSRSVIPYPRDPAAAPVYYEHIGVYAFRKQALLQFTGWPVSPLEAVEKIECLRYLENGVPIRMAITNYMGVEIDTPEDLERAARLL